MQQASLLVTLGIPALAVAVALLFAFGAIASSKTDIERRSARRALLGLVAVFAISGVLAASGVLATVRRPPPFMPLVLSCVVLASIAARSGVGARMAERLPLWALVGSQAFRFPLELVMRRAADEGTMPVEMSFGGYNFDVITGVSALLLATVLFASRATVPLRSDSANVAGSERVALTAIAIWNVVGVVLLTVIVGVAIAALPWFAAFGPTHVNEWVLHFPFVWLACVLVPAALFGHLVVFRRLRMYARHGTRQSLASPHPSSPS
jgi:hypothetical protein